MGLQILKRVTPEAYTEIQESIPQDLRKQAVKVVSGYSKPTAKRFAETFAYRFAEFIKSIFGQSDFQKLRTEIRRECRKELLVDEVTRLKDLRKSDQKVIVKSMLKCLILFNSLELRHVPKSKINAKLEKFEAKDAKMLERAKERAKKDAEKRAKIEDKKAQKAQKGNHGIRV